MSSIHFHKSSGAEAGIGVLDVLCRISDKWTLYVIGNLKDGPLRFNELRRSIAGISQRMLALTLRNLEQDGLVSRTVYETVPLRVIYSLTPLGQTLADPAGAMLSWAETHLDNIADSRRVFEGQDGKLSD
ncbi:MAG TPA: helix-turn-helix domain-containing protein [Noviherbaspirillum sp.]